MIFDKVFEVKERPVVNESIINLSRGNQDLFGLYGAFQGARPANFVKLVELVRRSPEAMGLIKAMVTDIVSDKWFFQPLNKDKKKGPESSKTAEDFTKKNFFKEELKKALFDWIYSGNSYLWMGKVSKAQLKEFAEKGVKATLKGLPFELKSKIKERDLFNDVYAELKQDEEITGIRSVVSAASSTMWIDYNKYGVVGYTQEKDAEKQIHFDIKEIIHAQYMPNDGKVYGFTPMISCIPILQTLALIKDYHGDFFNNGGMPDMMFSFPKEMAGSPVLKEFTTTLKQFKKKGQRRGNLAIAGEVAVEPLNNYNKDMEFRELANHYIGELALAFNMPMSRVATVLGRDVKSGNEDLANEGYWHQIAEMQKYWEDILNSQLFIPHFGVEIRFNRGYKQDQVRETQAFVQQLEASNKMKEMGFTDKSIRNYLNVTVEQLPVIKSISPIIGTPLQKPNSEIIPGKNKQIMNNKKKEEQNKKV